MIASVIISNSSREVDREFDYIIPESLKEFIYIGVGVVVPFGKYNTYTEGFVIDIKENSNFKGGSLKKIVDIIDKDLSLDEEAIILAKYIKDEYLCTLSDALNLLTPPKKNIKQVINIKFLSLSENLLKKEKEIISIIKDKEEITLEKLIKESGYKISHTDLLRLSNKGCITFTKDFIKEKREKEVNIYFLKDYDLCREFLNNTSNRAKKQIELVELLITEFGETYELSEMIEKFSTTPNVIKSLINKGILEKTFKRVYREAIGEVENYEKVPLTKDQSRAIDSIIENYKYGKTTSLIHGVTSCGKTEIYLNLVERFLKEDYGSIVLVPEIALTPQTVERFKGRFNNSVAILHSRLSDGERYDQYIKIKNGDYKVVIGARSAVFAPVHDLKLIIIDEEHEYSYKSESSPRYQTCKIARFRAERNGGIVVLGSATPSIESYYKALTGEYNLITIDKRIKESHMPSVNIVDMKNELMMGNKSIFSRELYTALNETILDNSQAILFLNRRGFSTFVSCRKCGFVCECDSCNVTLTYHHGSRKLKCHHCNKEYTIPRLCPKCQSKYIKYFGVGTEKVQEETQKCFKDARICRMDMDTTRKKGSYERIYKDFKNRNKDILIGTQMVSKGMDFDNVTLVGVISADITLNIPDFRASEKTFQLLTQVAGRAGRGEKRGKVIIQTYTPDHFSLQCAKEHDYIKFFNTEIENRKILNYPPFSELMHIVLTSENEDLLKGTTKALGKNIRLIIDNKITTLIGPSPCHIDKIKDKYRWHMIIKGNISKFKRQVLDLLQKNVQNKDIGFIIDIDPYSLT